MILLRNKDKTCVMSKVSLIKARAGVAVWILCTAGVLSAKEVVLLSERDGAPVEKAEITMYDSLRDSIGQTISDEMGRAILLKDCHYVLAQNDMFVPHMATLSEGETCDTVRMKRATEIQELVVDGTEKFGKAPHLSYVIPREDMKRYVNVLQSLNEIPNLVVLPDNEIFYEGSGNVKLLLNGVATSIEEVRALDKDDILKINTYPVAPARYRIEGYESVVDVITKSSLTGGNASIAIDQAPYPLIGYNSAALFYNYKSSRFSVIYSNNNNHQPRYRRSEFLDYEYDDVTYYKHKEGLDSHSNYDTNTLTLGYQNAKAGSYLYNAKLTGSISRNGDDILQKVVSQSNRVPYDANNELITGSNNIVLNNYFEKVLGEEGSNGLLITNLTLQRVNSNYISQYREFENGENIPTVNERSEYDIQYSHAVANVVYYLPYKKWGSLSFSIYDGFSYSSYKEPSVRTAQRVNTGGGWAQYYSYFGKFTILSMLGIENQYTYASVSDRKHCEWRPSASAHLYYNLSHRISLRASYSFSSRTPSISQLSQTTQWLDTKLVFHGNPNLHSFTTHTLSLGVVYNSKYLDFSFFGSYLDIPGRICENFQKGPDSMLETLINLDKYRELTGQLDFTIKPLGSNVWIIDTRIIGGLTRGSSPGYDWTGYRFQLMPYTAVNLVKWTLYARYQYPGKLAMGQLIMPRTQSWSVGCYYRPVENLSVGVGIGCPFGKGWKESQRTVDESPVQMNSEILAQNRANLVSLKLEWNVSFGKNRDKMQNQRLNINTDENGVLTR